MVQDTLFCTRDGPGATGRDWGNEKDYGPDLFLRYCQDFVRRNQQRPFFLYWAMGIPHAPYDATPDSTDPAVRDDIRMYPDMVAYMDKLIRKLVATVDEPGLAERTLIIFTATPETLKRFRDTNVRLPGRKPGGKKKPG